MIDSVMQKSPATMPGRAKVLICADENLGLIAGLADEFLIGEGFEVYIVHWWDDLRARFQSIEPDVIFADRSFFFSLACTG